jgi:hypothetical protein
MTVRVGAPIETHRPWLTMYENQPRLVTSPSAGHVVDTPAESRDLISLAI